MAPATSSTVPNRPSGICLRIVSSICLSSAFVRSVGTKPGATALQVMLRLAISRATVFVNPMRPAFAAE